MEGEDEARKNQDNDFEIEKLRVASLQAGVKYLRTAFEGGIADAGFQLGKLYEHVCRCSPPSSSGLTLSRVSESLTISTVPILTIFKPAISDTPKQLSVQQI
jgi:hypothetical protein